MNVSRMFLFFLVENKGVLLDTNKTPIMFKMSGCINKLSQSFVVHVRQ